MIIVIAPQQSLIDIDRRSLAVRAIPTPAQFEALEKAIEQFIATLGKRFSEIAEEIPDEPDCCVPETRVAEIAERFKAARSETIQSCFNTESDIVYAWIDGEPSFQIALQKLGFTTSGKKNPYEKIIELHLARKKWRSHLIKSSVLRHATLHIAYVGGIAKACHGFMTGNRRKAALEGPKAIQRMLSLMREIEEIRENTDFLGRPISIGGRFWEMTKSNMEGTLEHLFSTTKRDDKDLSARLMASELIRLHVKLFSAAHKNAVFHLMGLPFIDRPIEMKTIERLVALENVRTENLGSSKLIGAGREIIC